MNVVLTRSVHFMYLVKLRYVQVMCPVLTDTCLMGINLLLALKYLVGIKYVPCSHTQVCTK